MTTPAADALDRRIEQITQSLSTSAQPNTSFWSSADAMTVSALFLTFAVIMAGLATFLLHRGKTADEVLTTLGTVLVVTAATLMVVLGYAAEQIAPAIGLLGTVAGYFLGKVTSKSGQQAQGSAPSLPKPAGEA